MLEHQLAIQLHILRSQLPIIQLSPYSDLLSTFTITTCGHDLKSLQLNIIYNSYRLPTVYVILTMMVISIQPLQILSTQNNFTHIQYCVHMQVNMLWSMSYPFIVYMSYQSLHTLQNYIVDHGMQQWCSLINITRCVYITC